MVYRVYRDHRRDQAVAAARGEKPAGIEPGTIYYRTVGKHIATVTAYYPIKCIIIGRVYHKYKCKIRIAASRGGIVKSVCARAAIGDSLV
jgi:hypothetical protein